MPEIRRDPVTGRRVIVARERAARPNEFRLPAVQVASRVCPFCRGQEHQTPPAVLELSEPHAPDRWQVRVTPNKYPALALDGGESIDEAAAQVSTPAHGAHEVMIESPDHLASIAALSAEQYALVLAAYESRLQFWRGAAQRGAGLEYALVFKNSGPRAGASLEHLHSQLTVLPWVPPLVDEELRGAQASYAATGRCVYCQLIDEERAAGVRIVQESEHFLAFCPFASRFPLETWVLPKSHASHFENGPATGRAELASLLQQLVARLETLVERLAYNYAIHTAPLRALELGFYHWHIEITPRLAQLAGFELGGGVFINPVAPEEAAAQLRKKGGGRK